MNPEDVENYPLTWPPGWPRRPAGQRSRAKFGRGGRGASWADARFKVEDELRLLKATDVVISSNRRSGGSWEPKDPAAAVYFRLRTGAHCLPCDRWDRVADNVQAIALHIEAIRGQARWGVGSVEAAFAGYRALPAMDARKAWYEVLGFKEPPTASDLERKRDELVRRHHPDRGGNPNQMAEINAAYDEGRKAMGL